MNAKTIAPKRTNFRFSDPAWNNKVVEAAASGGLLEDTRPHAKNKLCAHYEHLGLGTFDEAKLLREAVLVKRIAAALKSD